jgi:hypothetical protein
MHLKACVHACVVLADLQRLDVINVVLFYRI